MAIVVEITRNLKTSIGNAYGWVFGGIFVWLWLAALLIVLGAFMLLAPAVTVEDGGRSLSELLAVIGGFLLAGAAIGWTGHKLGKKRERVGRRVGEFLAHLIIFGPIIGAGIWLWSSWEVADIWDRPLAALTLSDIAENILKLVIFIWGIGFIWTVVRTLIADWRK